MITIQDPISFDDSIDIYLDYKTRPKITVKMVNLTPYIDIDLAFNAYIASPDKSSEHSSTDSLEIIGKSASKYLKEQISTFSYKTSRFVLSLEACLGEMTLNSSFALVKFL